MNKFPLVLGLAATRQVGKDTLFARLSTLDYRFRRFAMADALKSDLATFVLQNFGVDVWTAEGEDKELVRPVLIAYGMCQRERDPGYWVKKVMAQIDAAATLSPDIIPTVCDVRFVNEALYLSAHYGDSFKLVNLTRDGAPPPTEEERKHFRAVEERADMRLHWGGDTLEKQLDYARQVCVRFGVEVSA